MSGISHHVAQFSPAIACKRLWMWAGKADIIPRSHTVNLITHMLKLSGLETILYGSLVLHRMLAGNVMPSPSPGF